jgi:hypothetical protein
MSNNARLSHERRTSNSSPNGTATRFRDGRIDGIPALTGAELLKIMRGKKKNNFVTGERQEATATHKVRQLQEVGRIDLNTQRRSMETTL